MTVYRGGLGMSGDIAADPQRRHRALKDGRIADVSAPVAKFRGPIA